MHLSEIVSILEYIAPPENAADFDTHRIGLNLNLDNDIQKIAVALDVTDNVLNIAASLGADLLITHHTLMFHAVHSISKNLAATLQIALNNQISLYSMHTNYDRAQNGINHSLAKRLELKNIKILDIGLIGEVEKCSSEKLAQKVAQKLNTHVIYVGNRNDISKVMVLGGSGFNNNFLEIAIDNKADAYISSELKHDIIRSRGDMVLIDATHYATEIPGMEDLCLQLSQILDLEVIFIDDNPCINII